MPSNYALPDLVNFAIGSLALTATLLVMYIFYCWASRETLHKRFPRQSTPIVRSENASTSGGEKRNADHTDAWFSDYVPPGYRERTKKLADIFGQERWLESLPNAIFGVGKKIDNDITECGRYVWSHLFFWECFSPFACDNMAGIIKRRIRDDLGGVESITKRMLTAAQNSDCSNWVWGIVSRDEFYITSEYVIGAETDKNALPVFAINICPNIYYLEYEGDIAEYIDDLFYNHANWGFIYGNFLIARKYDFELARQQIIDSVCR